MARIDEILSRGTTLLFVGHDLNAVKAFCHRAMLLEKVWDYNFDPQTNIIDQHISKLRQKLDGDGLKTLVHTVRGVGYVMRAP